MAIYTLFKGPATLLSIITKALSKLLVALHCPLRLKRRGSVHLVGGVEFRRALGGPE